LIAILFLGKIVTTNLGHIREKCVILFPVHYIKHLSEKHQIFFKNNVIFYTSASSPKYDVAVADGNDKENNTSTSNSISTDWSNDISRVCSRVLPIDIDIKPGSDPNSINPFSKGVIPVAILGSAEFDATEVFVESLRFGPDGAEPTHPNGHLADVNDDGFTDFVTHYKVKETGIALGDTEACITGEIPDGTPFEGCDDIRTVPN